LSVNKVSNIYNSAILVLLIKSSFLTILRCF